MPASKQGSKNAFISHASRDFGLNKKQSQSLYREFSKKYGGLVRASDLRKHPIVARRLSHEISKPQAAAPAKGVGVVKGAVAPERGRGYTKSVRTVTDWNEMYDDYDYETVEYESSADYGEVD